MKFVISTLFRFPLVFASESASEAAVKESWAAAVRKPKKVIPSETQTDRPSTADRKNEVVVYRAYAGKKSVSATNERTNIWLVRRTDGRTKVELESRRDNQGEIKIVYK